MQTNLGNTLNVQENGESGNISKASYGRIEGTPFVEVRQNGRKFLAFGEYQLTEDIGEETSSEDYLKENMWMIIASLTSAVTAITLNNQTK